MRSQIKNLIICLHLMWAKMEQKLFFDIQFLHCTGNFWISLEKILLVIHGAANAPSGTMFQDNYSFIPEPVDFLQNDGWAGNFLGIPYKDWLSLFWVGGSGTNCSSLFQFWSEMLLHPSCRDSVTHKVVMNMWYPELVTDLHICDYFRLCHKVCQSGFTCRNRIVTM